jgi:NADH:ubiquinone oxidoreductase subunit 3 (subunit A)
MSNIIGVLILLIFFLIILLLFLGLFINITYASTKNLFSYECGFEGIGKVRSIYSIHFYIIIIIFVIFDLELVLLLYYFITGVPFILIIIFLLIFIYLSYYIELYLSSYN